MRPTASAAKIPLEADVAGLEAERVVERGGPLATGGRGQLPHGRPTAACLLDGPLDQHGAEPAAAFVDPAPDRLDLAPQRALVGQARDEAQLQRADDLTAALGHHEHLAGV